MSRPEARSLSRHRAQPSTSSASSSDDSSLDLRSAQSERARRPSTSAPTRRFFGKESLPPSPVNARFAPGWERDGPGGYFDVPPMARTDSEGSYRMPWSSRHSDDDSDAVSVSSFSCSLGSEFDRHRELSDNNVDGGAVDVSKRKALLDSVFQRLSMKYRTAKPQQETKDKVKAAKPHFLDLSAIICPTPPIVSTPPASQHSSDFGPDSLTLRPSQIQRFADAVQAHSTNKMHLLRPALQPSLSANVIPVGSASSGPTSKSMRGHAASRDANTRENVVSPTSANFSRPALRTRRSFDNPAEVRRRQRDEWNFFAPDQENSVMPELPGWARSQNRSLATPTPPFDDRSAGHSGTYAHEEQRSKEAQVPQGVLFSQLNRSMAMSRGASHDPASAQAPVIRPRLASRASSSALRQRADLQPQSPDSWSTGLPPIMPYSPPLVSSRGSCGSSNGSDSMPPTPVSATYLRPLPAMTPPRMGSDYGSSRDGKEYVRDMSSSEGPYSRSGGAWPESASLSSKEARASDEDMLSHHLYGNATPRAVKAPFRPQQYGRPGSAGTTGSSQDSPPRKSSLKKHGAGASTVHEPWGCNSQFSDDGSSSHAGPHKPFPSSAPGHRDHDNDSRWSPSTPPSNAMPARMRANSRAEEWAAHIGRRFAKGINAGQKA